MGVNRLRRPGLLASVLAVGLLGMTADALIRARGEFDLELMDAVHSIDFPGAQPLFEFMSALTGSFWAITLWVVMLAVFLGTRRWLAAAAMASFPLVGAVNTALRWAIHRTRPDPAWRIEDPDAPNDYASFPSGHVVGAVLLWGFLFYLAGSIHNRYLRWAARTWCVAVIAMSGFSRPWLGAHWVGDVVAGYLLGGLVLLGVLVAYRAMAPTMTRIPLVRANYVPHDDTIRHAHALTSTVLFRGETVTKVYNPGFVPRFIYWLSFQAPFGYAHNPKALEAALLRRNLAGKLSEYWFGENRVAPALRIDEVDGRQGLTSALIPGTDPKDHSKARHFLFELANRFDEAGLPTWQIDPRQPRSLGNILEGPDGVYRIIDLESGLVSPLASPRAWWRAVRRSMVPMYDDVYFDTTRAYIEEHRGELLARFGEPWLSDLGDLLDRAETAAAAWHADEPRLWSWLARAFWSGFGLLVLPRWLQAKADAGRLRADGWLQEAIARWEAEGRLTREEAQRAHQAIDTPELQALLPHFGVHLLIGVALRFPFGSIARVVYTSGNLLAATARFALRRSDRAAWRRATRIHSPLVILFAAMPGIGTFSYLASGPVRSNRIILRLGLDAVGEKVPFHLYRRLGFRRLIAGRARDGSATSPLSPAEGGHG